MGSMKVFTIESGSVKKGAVVEMFRLTGGTDIPAIVIGEVGRGRKQGVLPVANPPKISCPDRHVDYLRGPRSEQSFRGNEPGPKPERTPVCKHCGQSYSPWKLFSFNEGKGQGWRSVHPDRGEVLATLLFAEEGTSQSGRPKLVATDHADTADSCIAVFRTSIGFRGGNSHTGDRSAEMVPCKHAGKIGQAWEQGDGTCSECGAHAEWVFYNGHPEVRLAAQAANCDLENGTFRHPDTQVQKHEWAPFPGQIITEGVIAQGDAGAMGSGQQLVAVMPKGIVFRTGYSGRLYGGPSAHYYMFDGEKILVATWDERQLADLF